MSETKNTVLLKHHLKSLRLPTMERECEKVATRTAKENLDHLTFLLQLVELEMVDREHRAADAAVLGQRLEAQAEGPPPSADVGSDRP